MAAEPGAGGAVRYTREHTWARPQPDGSLVGGVTALVLTKAGLTYLVPFSVSTYSARAANRL